MGSQIETSAQPESGPPVRSTAGLGVWCDNIPISEIEVGDHVKAIVRCQKRRLGTNEPRRESRTGTVTVIHGKIVQLKCARGGALAVTRDDIFKAWGHRKTPNIQ